MPAGVRVAARAHVRGGVQGGAWRVLARKWGAAGTQDGGGGRALLCPALGFWRVEGWLDGISGPPHWLGKGWRVGGGGQEHMEDRAIGLPLHGAAPGAVSTSAHSSSSQQRPEAPGLRLGCQGQSGQDSSLPQAASGPRISTQHQGSVRAPRPGPGGGHHGVLAVPPRSPPPCTLPHPLRGLLKPCPGSAGDPGRNRAGPRPAAELWMGPQDRACLGPWHRQNP